MIRPVHTQLAQQLLGDNMYTDADAEGKAVVGYDSLVLGIARTLSELDRRPDAVFISVDQAAGALGVAASWLRRELDNGALPYLEAGRKLVNLDQLRAQLLLRATMNMTEVSPDAPTA